MNAYGTVLKQLIQLTGSKLSTISDVIGYDRILHKQMVQQIHAARCQDGPEINRSMASLLLRDFEPGNSGRF
ncbi:MAG: hypothetical protein ACLUI7_02705 [Coprococcus sp.]